MEQVEGKTAFITGGASGMGLGMARVFARNGAKVIIADMRQDAIDEAMGLFSGADAVHAINLDVTDRDAYTRAADEAERVFGNVHILVNNAGVAPNGSMQEATYKDWDFIMSVNVGGVVNGLVTFLPRMLKHGEPSHIITTSSTGGFFAVGAIGLYCTTKYAVAGMMESLATDLVGTNINASVFFAGPVKTNLGVSTYVNRPESLRNEEHSMGYQPGIDPVVMIDPLEVGERILRGIKRNDLFIMSHQEFRKGIIARNEALLRALPDEPLNMERYTMMKSKKYGNLLHNPIYDTQTTPGELSKDKTSL
jgi:NAD(P)-dependent dehydrogenase (short-subunit alcohol dehydrogenase family)